MTVDNLWFLADQARQRAEQVYHRLQRTHTDFLEPVHTRRVSRERFRTLATRVKSSGTPYGAHTIVRRGDDEVLLVRHDGVGMWVLPGGGVDGGERFSDTARRELGEEAGITADYDGLAMVTKVKLRSDGHQTWGVMPIYQARADDDSTPVADDPDGEVSAARWFQIGDLPADTRDKADIRAWFDHVTDE